MMYETFSSAYFNVLARFKCEYCKQIFIPGERGGCICCGAPEPENGMKFITEPPERIAILSYGGTLTEEVVERIERSWNLLFPHKKLIVLEEGMKLEFVEDFLKKPTGAGG